MKINLTILFLILFNLSSFAENFDLKECLAYALKNNDEIKEISYKKVEYLSNVKQAEAAKNPKVSILTYVAPSYKVTGNALHYDRYYNVWGPYWHSKIEMQMPVYTWGKIDFYENAALNGVKVSEEEIEQKKREIEFDVKKYYYGLLLARTLNDVVDNVLKVLDEAIKKATELYEKGEGEIKKSELEMLKVYMAEALKNKNEAEKSVIMARLALMQKMGMSENENFDIQDKKIKQIDYNLREINYYIDLAFKNRAEWKMLNYGIEAKNYLYKAQNADKYPVFFLGGEFSYDYAPHITDQKNPWLNDNFNNIWGGIAVGAKFDLNVKEINAKSDIKKAELDSLKTKKDFAKDGIILQVKNSYYTAVQYFKTIQSAKNGLNAAEKWIMAAGFLYGIGTGDVKDALEGVAAKAKAQKDYYEAIYNYNLSLAELAKNCGITDFEE